MKTDAFFSKWEIVNRFAKSGKNTCLAKRAGEREEEIDITELVPGDIVYLAAGDTISPKRFTIKRYLYYIGHISPASIS